jgi:DNA-binding NarL/FixJ family response regulator
MSIRVLLADNQALVRAGFRMILEAQPDIEVVGEAADCDHAVRSARRLRPDVIVMDAPTLSTHEVSAIRQLVAGRSGARVLILGTVDRDEHVYAVIRAGASGFMLKDAQPAQLVEAVRVVARGEALLAPSVTRRLLERLAHMLPGSSAPPQLSSLSTRELEVLRLLATGLSNAELAERLFLAEATVKTHLSSVLRKLERRDRVQAVILAYDAGLVRPAWADQAVAPPRHRSTQPLAGNTGYPGTG